MRDRGEAGTASTRISVRSPSSVRTTTSRVPSVEPPSLFTRTVFASGKWRARPAATARTTCPIVRALLKDGIPTKRSTRPSVLSRVITSASSSGAAITVMSPAHPFAGHESLHGRGPSRPSGRRRHGGVRKGGAQLRVEARLLRNEDGIIHAPEKRGVVRRVAEPDGPGRAEELEKPSRGVRFVVEAG